VQQVLKRCPHSYVITGPTKYTDAIHDVGPVPNDNVSQLISDLPKSFNERYMYRDPLVFPPHIRDINHAVTVWSQQGQ
jgi:hypothetical protein